MVVGGSGCWVVVGGERWWWIVIGGNGWCCVFRLEYVHRQIISIAHDKLCCLALKTNEPKKLKLEPGQVTLYLLFSTAP